jgi:hypothetical protein
MPPKGVVVGQHQVTVEIDGHTLDFWRNRRRARLGLLASGRTTIY